MIFCVGVMRSLLYIDIFQTFIKANDMFSYGFTNAPRLNELHEAFQAFIQDRVFRVWCQMSWVLLRSGEMLLFKTSWGSGND